MTHAVLDPAEPSTTTGDLVIAGRRFRSRLIVGTGKFSSPEVMADALAASRAEIVTVALRRLDLDAKSPAVTEFIDRERYLIMPNTSGAQTADEAVRLARLARSAGLPAIGDTSEHECSLLADLRQAARDRGPRRM